MRLEWRRSPVPSPPTWWEEAAAQSRACGDATRGHAGAEGAAYWCRLSAVQRGWAARAELWCPPRDFNTDTACKRFRYIDAAFVFLGSNLRVIPVHNTADTIKVMLTIAKATGKPHIDNIRNRLMTAKKQIIEHSCVWKMLQNT
ncbi:hypothetical protein NDU88_002902 [Pleurodeles waltl]|uniref:Uncharacterized protein n=1 Tax=Pleurodeles waltl TaxID=8319 RepID=A0AAV7T3T5_PLEWA|nr:hypothetical protein NDU88_002902 [Pleurodeles waltl]